MLWVTWTLEYVLIHFLCYALILRHLRRFSRERVIFAYHAVSELGVAVVLVVGAISGLWPNAGLAGWLAAVGIHGIYSLTFLALWSLASGGYSIGILARIATVGEAIAVEHADLAEIGDGKQKARLRGIQALGLIRARAEYVETSRRGALVATALATIAAVFSVRESG